MYRELPLWASLPIFNRPHNESYLQTINLLVKTRGLVLMQVVAVFWHWYRYRKNSSSLRYVEDKKVGAILMLVKISLTRWPWLKVSNNFHVCVNHLLNFLILFISFWHGTQKNLLCILLELNHPEYQPNHRCWSCVNYKGFQKTKNSSQNRKWRSFWPDRKSILFLHVNL